LPAVQVYLDAVLVCGKNQTEHDERLLQVCSRLVEWGFHLQPEKCKFSMSSVRYLGFIISADGIQPDPQRIEALRSLRAPSNVKELRSFLGLVNYYGKFVLHLHKYKGVFEALLQKDVPFNWTHAHREAFDAIKRLLTGPLLLAHYDPDQTLIVAADATSTGIGGVLLQRYADGHEKAVFHM